jgi:catechol 2,3-dioxygenase-like lactoylglutathione lyase family enzyme
MEIDRLDHVALWVADRDALAGELVGSFGMHVIERTERFTLVGADARRGKLTLFAAEGPREPGQLAAIGLRVPELERAVAALDRAHPVEPDGDRRATVTLSEGLRLTLVEAPSEVPYDLDHVSLRVADATAARDGLLRLGFERAADGRLSVGDALLELVEDGAGQSERPLLNHLGLLVASASAHLEEARALGVEVADVVDAPNTIAVFVWGPERLKLEYVEHKPTFALR